MLDTFREVYTPEGVALHLPAAGPVPRAVAWSIDLAIRCGVCMVASMVFGAIGKGGIGFYLLFLFVVLWAYPVVFEGVSGQTPGKRVMELRVVSVDGAPIGWLSSLVRNLLRTVDMLPFGYATGLLTGLIDPWGRRLGDIVAGTVVVHSPRARKRQAMPEQSARAPLLALRADEQAAFIAFGERANDLTAERQRELADLAEAATGATGDAGVLRLIGIGHWLLGRR
ncbi:MAG: RDD family protein [Luteimonas sp.]